MSNPTAGSNDLVDYEPTVVCVGVDEAVNPVQYFHRHHPKSKDAGPSQGPVSDLMLLSGALRGIVHVPGQLASGEELQATMQALVKARDTVLPAGGQGCLFDSMASESEFQVFPVVLKKPEGFDGMEPLEAAVAALGISRSLGDGSPPVKSFDTVEAFLEFFEKNLHLDEIPDSAPDGRTMLQAARQLFLDSGLTQGRYMQVVSGDEVDEDNPVLVFWLGCHKDAPYLLGLMSAIIWT